MQVPKIDKWVRESLAERLFPVLLRLYELTDHSLHFRDLFFVKYEAKPGEQAGLDLHRDGSILSFNLLLNSRDDFEGGGTYFEQENNTYCLQRGDCLAHSGKADKRMTKASCILTPMLTLHLSAGAPCRLPHHKRPSPRLGWLRRRQASRQVTSCRWANRDGRWRQSLPPRLTSQSAPAWRAAPGARPPRLVCPAPFAG